MLNLKFFIYYQELPEYYIIKNLKYYINWILKRKPINWHFGFNLLGYNGLRFLAFI